MKEGGEKALLSLLCLLSVFFYCSKSNKSNKVKEVNANRAGGQPASPNAVPGGDRVWPRSWECGDPPSTPSLRGWLPLKMTLGLNGGVQNEALVWRDWI